SLPQQDGLPCHASNLQQSYQYQSACEPSESVLYLEILSALLAGLIASWGGWLWGGGHRFFGALVAGLAIWLFLSFATALTFGDPVFWRPMLRLLTRQEADGRYYKHSDYRHPLNHYPAIVPHKLLDSHVLLGYIKYMANALNADKQTAIIAALAE